MFPDHRPRRLRSSVAFRSLVAEVELRPRNFVLPLFVKESLDRPEPIASLPGVYQHTLESMLDTVRSAISVGVRSVIVFGVPKDKDPEGSQADAHDGIVQRALGALRSRFGDDIVIMADTCLDEFTDHGHCGILTSDGRVDNDATLERYQLTAIAQAHAGAHVIAPSGMMDGQVGAIRAALDETGHAEIPILAYAAKYASALYGPFRDAAECAPSFGDRAAYQMDPSMRREAALEVSLDIAEGADMVMVKPALSYLDVLSDVRSGVDVPVGAYHVSGEYAMVMAAGTNGWIDGDRVMDEHLLSIRRAGADFILTYAAIAASQRIHDRA
ncbi:MAG: porphobilinogen synthase [Acidimicrobiia bacterium]|jgi:porphobilinogen synthase|nr:porphobilinogen synthase [Acidimicrobiia bacterium]MBP8179909.1 porphobilinogen synthase [Acidimicrobiia bacterium]